MVRVKMTFIFYNMTRLYEIYTISFIILSKYFVNTN